MKDDDYFLLVEKLEYERLEALAKHLREDRDKYLRKCLEHARQLIVYREIIDGTRELLRELGYDA
jgi:hypothetical protein